MTGTEYGLRYLDDDGTWRRSLSEPDPIATSARAVTALDHAREAFRGAEWRLVTRTVPDWGPADEAALRGGGTTEGAYAALAADSEETTIEGVLPDRHRRLLHYNRSYVEGTIDVLDQPIGEDQ